MKENKSYVKSVNYVINYLLKNNGLSDFELISNNILNILFSGFKIIWVEENQKFDFSYSFRRENIGSLRFSYNNYGEKKEFNKKIETIFELLDGGYNTLKLKRLFTELECERASFQTTFGIEWLEREKNPRIKIYFEEIHQNLSRAERIVMLKKIADIINYDYLALGVKDLADIGAIGIDFLSGDRFNLKIYYKSDNLDDKALTAHINNKNISDKAINLFNKILCLEKACFFYLAIRFNLGKFSSVKIYKIYEVAQISNFSNTFKEIFVFLKVFGLIKPKKEFIIFLKDLVKKKINIFPVISSIDISINNDFKLDLYFSIKK